MMRSKPKGTVEVAPRDPYNPGSTWLVTVDGYVRLAGSERDCMNLAGVLTKAQPDADARDRALRRAC